VTRFAAIMMTVAWMGVVVPDVALAANAQTIRCESSARETVRCKADTRGGVVLQRQLSRAGCWYDETWGFDKNGVWVSNGCRADFTLGRSTASTPPAAAATPKPPATSDGVAGTGLSGGEIAAGALVIGAIAAAVIASQSNDDDDDRHEGKRRNDPWGRDQVVRCESSGKKERYCRANTKRGVELYRQLSKARCRYGSSWGYDRKGIWVDEGCRADFLIRG
jgi:hypothetical protein